MFHEVPDQSGPQAPLLAPVEGCGDRLQPGQVNRVAAVLGRRQEQDLLLDVRGQMEQVHDLGYPRPGHVAQLGQLAVVRDATSLDRVVKPDGPGP